MANKWVHSILYNHKVIRVKQFGDEDKSEISFLVILILKHSDKLILNFVQ